MKVNRFLYGILGLSIGIGTGCKPKYSDPEMSSGSINLDRFAMLGDGHSAGFMDDALYYDGQNGGLAELLGRQFELVGGGPLTTRFVSENSVGSNASGKARMILDFKVDCKGDESLSPVRKANVGDLNIITSSSFSGEAKYRNLAIPGMGIMNSTAENYAQFNPFYARVASSSSASVIQDIFLTDPTFVGVYLGLEDVLTYAKSGGVTNSLPHLNDFTMCYSLIAEMISTHGAKGFVATIPDVTLFPYFRTIPYNGLNIQAENDVNLLNSIFGPLGIHFELGANAFNIVDPDANEFQVRQITSNELLLLSIPLDSVKCFKMGSVYPFRNEFVLTQVEISLLRNTINAYNNAIRDIAANYNLALIETDPIYQKLFSGFLFNGVKFSAQFVSGGVFSLDGIHLNSKGNAFLANEFIKVINQHYQAKIPLLNPGNFNGVLFP